MVQAEEDLATLAEDVRDIVVAEEGKSGGGRRFEQLPLRAGLGRLGGDRQWSSKLGTKSGMNGQERQTRFQHAHGHRMANVITSPGTPFARQFLRAEVREFRCGNAGEDFSLIGISKQQQFGARWCVLTCPFVELTREHSTRRWRPDDELIKQAL